jgi:hypothetical protein
VHVAPFDLFRAFAAARNDLADAGHLVADASEFLKQAFDQLFGNIRLKLDENDMADHDSAP